MIFRIYRLPGSRGVWHLDTGFGTQIINVIGFDCRCASHAVDMGDIAEMPRAWIEIINAELHIIDGIAFFDSLKIKAESA